jgi:hypothetical protein
MSFPDTVLVFTFIHTYSCAITLIKNYHIRDHKNRYILEFFILCRWLLYCGHDRHFRKIVTDKNFGF